MARQAAVSFDFSGHVVLVTGAGAGIGQAIAQAFHAAGARVALGDMREAPLTRTAAGLGTGVFAQTWTCGTPPRRRLRGRRREGAGSAHRRRGQRRIYPNSPVLDMSVEEWDRVMETNVRGVFLTCQAAARRMTTAKTPGKIITISSGAYNSGRVGASHYCASKAAVVMFTKVLALELAGQHVNVNCIAPGLITVNSEASPVTPRLRGGDTKQIPWGRAGTPQDIAQAALYLASPYADYVTGEVLSVNGGASAGRAYLPLSTPRPR